MPTPLIRSQSCPNLRRELPAAEVTAGKLNEHHIEYVTSTDNSLTLPMAKTAAQYLTTKYATPAKITDVEYELAGKMKLDNLTPKAAFAKLNEEDPEMAFRMWCDHNGKNVPDDLSEDPEQSYLLLCEYQQITPDTEKLNQFHEMNNPKTASAAIEYANRVVEHSKAVTAKAKKQLEALNQKMAARRAAEGA